VTADSESDAPVITVTDGSYNQEDAERVISTITDLHNESWYNEEDTDEEYRNA